MRVPAIPREDSMPGREDSVGTAVCRTKKGEGRNSGKGTNKSSKCLEDSQVQLRKERGARWQEEAGRLRFGGWGRNQGSSSLVAGAQLSQVKIYSETTPTRHVVKYTYL